MNPILDPKVEEVAHRTEVDKVVPEAVRAMSGL